MLLKRHLVEDLRFSWEACMEDLQVIKCSCELAEHR
jgi:hypothetical protein